MERDVEFITAEAEIGDAVDEAYRTKYARYPGQVEPMVSADAGATTLKLLPRAEEVH